MSTTKTTTRRTILAPISKCFVECHAKEHPHLNVRNDKKEAFTDCAGAAEANRLTLDRTSNQKSPRLITMFAHEYDT